LPSQIVLFSLAFRTEPRNNARYGRSTIIVDAPAVIAGAPKVIADAQMLAADASTVIVAAPEIIADAPAGCVDAPMVVEDPTAVVSRAPIPLARARKSADAGGYRPPAPPIRAKGTIRVPPAGREDHNAMRLLHA
jgi:hypothetical protein